MEKDKYLLPLNVFICFLWILVPFTFVHCNGFSKAQRLGLSQEKFDVGNLHLMRTASPFTPPHLGADLNELELAEELTNPKLVSESKWLYHYRLASVLLKRGELLTACSYLLDLMGESRFPLQDFATLKAYLYCSNSLSSLPDFRFRSYRSKWWTHSLVEEVYLTKLNAPYMVDKPKEVLKALIYFANKYKRLQHKRKEISFLSKASDWIQTHSKELDSYLKDIQERLYALSPSHKEREDLKKEEWIVVADDYAYLRKWNEAIYLYEEILETRGLDFQDYDRAYKGLYRVYRSKGRRDKSNKVAKQRLDWVLRQLKHVPPDTETLWKTYHDAVYIVIRRLWTKNKTEEAIQYLQRAIKELDGKYSRKSLYYLLGRIENERRQREQAIAWFDLALAEKKENGNSAENFEDIYWSKAWALLELSQYQKASVVLSSMVNLFSNSSRQYLFWLAFCLHELGRKDEAKAKWQTLAEEDFMGYYGLLSYYKLDKNLPVLDVAKAAKAAEDSRASKEIGKYEAILQKNLGRKAFMSLEWLYAAEEWPVLIRVLDVYFLRWQDKFEKRKKQDVRGNDNDIEAQEEDTILALLTYYARARDFLLLFRKMRSLPVEVRRTLLFSYTHFLFPRIYQDEVRQTSSYFNLEENLIYAIIRQESSFNWKARSPVGALGLMQLMPATARRVHRRYDMDFPLHGNGDILKVENNLLLGTAFLKELEKEYSNQWLLMAAAYNAGSTPLDHWLSVYKDTEKGMLFFIENIPYKETRNYVKLLFRNLVFYDLLEGESAFKKIPAELLEF